jgi:hypothetical protein
MIYTFIAARCADLPVAACCRVMKVSTSGFYAWKACPDRASPRVRGSLGSAKCIDGVMLR